MYIRQRLWPVAAALLPLALWGMLWLSVSPGSTGDIWHPGSPTSLIHGLRALFPFAASGLAVMLLAFKLSRHYPKGFRFLSPLGLTTVYGLVGVLAVWNSPDNAVALRWVALYLSVPLVLWAIVWGTDPLEQLRRIISITWLVIVLGTLALFAIALIYLDMWDVLTDPARLQYCNTKGWFDLTSHHLRETGVGRYAAVTAILAIGGLWQRNWRAVWTIVLVLSVVLLLFSGARTAFGGFAAGAVLTVLLYSGKRALLAGALITIVLVPVFWATGVQHDFLDRCLFRTAGPITTVLPTEQGQLIGLTEQGQLTGLTEQGQLTGLTGQGGSAGRGELFGPDIPSIQAQPTVILPEQAPSRVGREFLQFSGRSAVWAEALRQVRDSPILGYGFHADRLLLGTHAHNAFVHALLQTGVAGIIPFVLAMLFGWFSFFKVAMRLNQLPTAHKHLVIQSGAILAFLSVRALPESTGAFFGIDWLILAPLLLYLHLVSSQGAITPSPSPSLSPQA